MRNYILRRFLLFIPTVLGATIIIFIIMRVAPGDVALILAAGGLGGEEEVTEKQVEQYREKLGLNRPLYVQYLTWVGGFVVGQWGESIWESESILTIVGRRWPLTFELAIMAIVLAFIIALPAGIISAVRQDTPIDYVARFLSYIGLAIPNFWLGIMTMFILAAYLGWLPPLTYVPPWENPWDNFSQLIFPAIVVGTAQAAIITRMTRSSILEVLREDYIRTAHAKGLSGRVVMWRHALKNAMIPVITITGVQLGHLIGGTVVTEIVFNLPGLGNTLVWSVRLRDYPVVQTVVLIITLGYLVVNLGTDLLYSWLNPRVVYQ